MRFGTDCFVFSNHSTGVVGLVPVSSDTADEAINAFIASTVTYRAVTEPLEAAYPVESTAPNGLPANVMRRIKAKAEKDWPDDYSMQVFRIEKEVNAYMELQENE